MRPLAIWLELGEDDKTAYSDVKEKLLKRMKPDAFRALDELHKRVMRPDEPPALYAHRLKRMVDQKEALVIRWFYTSS